MHAVDALARPLAPLVLLAVAVYVCGPSAWRWLRWWWGWQQVRPRPGEPDFERSLRRWRQAKAHDRALRHAANRVR